MAKKKKNVVSIYQNKVKTGAGMGEIESFHLFALLNRNMISFIK
jgi:hypothetical protein